MLIIFLDNQGLSSTSSVTLGIYEQRARAEVGLPTFVKSLGSLCTTTSDAPDNTVAQLVVVKSKNYYSDVETNSSFLTFPLHSFFALLLRCDYLLHCGLKMGGNVQ